ncbi:dihydroxyacetone kinase subunit L [Actinomyces bowdenii]|uniref:Dihydroxyacetone kinase subunit L n=1 Tax=Actinomyces bowdenii TaxID=131109 RepID=A0A3P1V9B0_9ACTO|nr:dihydroxyacetone kinase subunit L [Actinomyces bowdenii]
MSRAPGVEELGPAELRAWLHECSALVSAHAEELTALDAAIGDADHGANMKRGLSAVEAVLEAGSFETIGALLKKAGMTLVSTVGGASGPLYGTFFMRMGAAAGTASALDARGLVRAVSAGVEGIAARGRAITGEKTMLDAWSPALEALSAHPEDLAAGTAAAARAAEQGRRATEAMIATKGRASYLAERSVGHIDPGAASTALILQALARVVAGGGAADGDAGPAAQGAPAPAPGPEEGGACPQGSAGREAAAPAAAPAEPATRAQASGTTAAPAEVGIVLVSHSRALAQAAADLATGLVAGLDVVVEIAAGLPDGGLGTDGSAVAAAITRVARGGTAVLVLADLGSAIMSAEAALEQLDAPVAARTRISAAPFIEGLVGAYAAAGIGRGLEAVAAEALTASAAKEAQIGAS